MDDISVLFDKNNNLITDIDELKKIYIAVPYVAVDTPSQKSEFSDYLYTTALTVLSYYDTDNGKINRIRNVDLCIYVDYINDMYTKNKFMPITSNIGLKLFAALTKGLPNIVYYEKFKVTDFTKSQLKKVKENFYIRSEYNKPIELLLCKKILPKYIRVQYDFENISFVDIIKSDFSIHRTGFTGTPFIHIPLEIDNTKQVQDKIRQKYGDGSIIASIIGIDRPTRNIKIDETKFIDNIIDCNHEIDVFIDTYDQMFRTDLAVDRNEHKLKIKKKVKFQNDYDLYEIVNWILYKIKSFVKNTKS